MRRGPSIRSTTPAVKQAEQKAVKKAVKTTVLNIANSSRRLGAATREYRGTRNSRYGPASGS